MAEKAFLDGEGLRQTVEWLRNKDVGEYTDDTRTNEIFNDYYNNIAKGTYNHAEGYQTKALGAYNHAEGYNTSAGSYKDAYFRYCGNPILQVPNSTDVISKVSLDSNAYQIDGKTGTFLLDKIDLPEDFKVGKYSSTLNIFNYDYIFNENNNEWYTIQSIMVEMTDELKSLFTTLFENNSSINRKIYKVSAEPTEISDNLYIYNGAIYCSAFTDNKITVSEDTINTLTTINTLESQTDDGYITTIYVNESNYFGFVYYFNDDNLILSKQQYNIDTIYNINNLTNNYGTFKKIDKVYQSAPTIITQEGVVCGTSYNSSTTPQYSGNSGKWEYLNEYNVILSITESDRVIYDSEGNPTGELNPSLVVTHYNAEDLINKTVDFNTDNINFVYSKTITEEATTLDWYLNDTIVDLADYGISVENPQEYDIITFELNRFYISYDLDGRQRVKNQEEFYIDNHASGTTSYIFDGTASGNWVKTVKDGEIDNSDSCHAEGHGSIAVGKYAHAEGIYTKANKDGDHAEGFYTATGLIPVKYFKNRPIEIPSSKISYLKFKYDYKPMERYDKGLRSYSSIDSDELTELFTIKDCFGNEQFITNYKVYLSTSAYRNLNYRWIIKSGNGYKKCKINWTTAQEYPLDYLPSFCYSNEEKTGVPVFSDSKFILTTNINDFGSYDSGFLLENNNYYSYNANTKQKVLVTSSEVTKFCSLVDEYTGIDLFTNFKNTKEKTTIYFKLSQSVHPDSLLNTPAYGWYFWLNKDENNEVIGLVGAKADIDVCSINYFYGIPLKDFVQNYSTIEVGILVPSNAGYFQSMQYLFSDNEYAYVDDIRSIYFYKEGENYSYKEVRNYTYDGGTMITKDDVLNIFSITSSDLETTYYKTSSWIFPSGGTYAHAEGQSNNAIARASHAEGQNTSTYGECSHAEGAGSTAYGNVSHAENNSTIAIGDCSHAEGSGTKTIGDNAHAEGAYTVAKGFNSHTEGVNTETRGNQSHAEGNESIAAGYQSHSEGYKTYAEGNQSHAEGNETVSKGNQSHAEGTETYAEGDQSHAEGNETVSRGEQSHSEGYKTEANGSSSHTEGTFTKANAPQAHAEGYYNEANGQCSHTEGVYNKSNGNQSHTEGHGNEVAGDNGHAEGSLNIIENAGNAHAEGARNIITELGKNSHVEGVRNTVNACNAHIEGIQNIANKGSLNHIEGYNNIVNNIGTEGANHIGGTSNTSTNSVSSLIHGYKNNSENNNSSLITGSFNDSKGDNQLIAGFGLKEEEIPVTSTTILGRYNKDLSDQFEYIEVIETVFIEGKHYFRVDENNEYSEILLLLEYDSSPKNSNYYEFTGDGYVATTDSNVVTGKDYYKLVGDKYLLIKIISAEIDIYPIYEKINKYSFIIGTGQDNTHRTNSLELDYQGNLKTSGDIVNGNGVVVGAYISNEKIDEIWDSVFGGGRVCLVQTSS